jgi:hypothetical protein
VALKRPAKLLDNVRWKLARTASRGPEKGSWILDYVRWKLTLAASRGPEKAAGFWMMCGGIRLGRQSVARDVRRVGNVPVYWLLAAELPNRGDP